MSVIVRNCPSPTGLLHIGTLRTALYNYLFAKSHGGKIVFRSEDTDKERSSKAFEENIVSGLINMGMLDPNTPIIHQSERTETYKKYLKQLVDEDKAYFCFLTSAELDALRAQAEKEKRAFRYPGTFRDYPKDEALKRIQNGEKAVIRLKTPQNKDISFNDLIRGENKTNSKDFDDFVIAKDFETPLYNFCVVIDDHEMGITHVIRGEDHIPNTPKQIMLYDAFGWEMPEFAHLPLILNEDRSKLSKRKNKVSVDDFLEEGYLPEALLNFLVLIGWNPGGEQEIFTLDEMIKLFSLDRVHKGGAVFDQRKLDWINGIYIRNLSVDELHKRTIKYLTECHFHQHIHARGDEYLKKVLVLVREKMKKLSEITELVECFYTHLHPRLELICNEKMKVDQSIGKEALEASLQLLKSLNEKDFSAENIKAKLIEIITQKGWKNGQLLWPLRAALTGAEASPGAFEVAEVLGKEESVRRLESAVTMF